MPDVSAAAAGTPAGQAAYDLVVVHDQLEYDVQRGPGLEQQVVERPGLRHVAGEAVEQEPLAGVVLLSRAPQNLNLRCARMHVIGDTFSSVGVLAAGGIIALTGWERLDAIMGGAIALIIAVGSIRLVREAVDVLLEATPAGIDLDEVSRAIVTVPGVIEVHDLHIWSITTGLPALSGHVRLDDAPPGAGDDMLNRIKETVRDRFGIVHTTIQIESRGYEELGDVH